MRETDARSLAVDVSAFWAGRVENWPGWVEFCIEHIRDICFQMSPRNKNLVSHTVYMYLEIFVLKLRILTKQIPDETMESG